MGNQKAIALGIGVGIGAIALASRKAKGASIVTTAINPAKVRVGEFFTLDEFLRSKTLPQLASYQPTPAEFANLRSLVAGILDPARRRFGPILITSGGRPESVAVKAGTTWEKALSKKGYNPAEKSDHADFSAADIKFQRLAAKDWLTAYQEISANPLARQVILYSVTGADGKTITPTHIHVAVALPGKPVFGPEKHHFLKLDGKRVTTA